MDGEDKERERVMGQNNAWTKYLVGVLVTLILIITIPTLTKAVIDNDKASRARDEKLNDKFQEAIIAQQMTNEKVAVDLGKIMVILEYIKQKVQ